MLKESVSLPVKRGVSQLYIFGTGCSLGEKHSISLIYTFPKRWMDGWMDGNAVADDDAGGRLVAKSRLCACAPFVLCATVGVSVSAV